MSNPLAATNGDGVADSSDADSSVADSSVADSSDADSSDADSSDADSSDAEDVASEFESISQPPMPDTDPWGRDNTEDGEDLEESSGEHQEDLEIGDGMDVPISTLPVPSVYQELEDLPPTVGDRSSFALADTTHGNAKLGRPVGGISPRLDRIRRRIHSVATDSDNIFSSIRMVDRDVSRRRCRRLFVVWRYQRTGLGESGCPRTGDRRGNDPGCTRTDRFAVRRASGWGRFSRHRDGNGGHTTFCLRGSV